MFNPKKIILIAGLTAAAVLLKKKFDDKEIVIDPTANGGV